MTGLRSAPSKPPVGIEVICAHGFRSVGEQHFQVPVGTTVFQALQKALQMGLVLEIGPVVLQAHGEGSAEVLQLKLEELVQSAQLFLSVWGEPCGLETQLEHNARLELTKALRVDPKVARRERFKKQGTKGAGLFAKIRDGAKAGY